MKTVDFITSGSGCGEGVTLEKWVDKRGRGEAEMKAEGEGREGATTEPGEGVRVRHSGGE
jgi:hypothetical protein